MVYHFAIHFLKNKKCPTIHPYSNLYFQKADLLQQYTMENSMDSAQQLNPCSSIDWQSIQPTSSSLWPQQSIKQASSYPLYDLKNPYCFQCLMMTCYFCQFDFLDYLAKQAQKLIDLTKLEPISIFLHLHC